MKMAEVPNRGATFALALFLFVANAAGALYAARGVQPSEAFLWLCYLVVAFLVAHWVLVDERRLGIPGSVDQGWFLFAVWPLALPYYLFRTRRWRGFIALGWFVALFLATW